MRQSYFSSSKFILYFILYNASALHAFHFAFTDNPFGLPPIRPLSLADLRPAIVRSLYKHKRYNLLLIKLFNRLHNTETISIKTPEKAHKIVNETLKVFIILSIFLKTKTSNVLEIEELTYKVCYQNLFEKQLVR